MNHAGQHMHVDVELGTSVEEIMASEEPMVKSLTKGFKVKYQTCFISNVKKLLLQISKSDNEIHKMFAMQALMVAPATMLTLNANIDLSFDDFQEVEDHELA